MDSLRAYGVLTAALLAAAVAAPWSIAGSLDPPMILEVQNTLDSGPGSLRQALLDANAQENRSGGPDVITFNISGPGVHRIEPLSALPYIDDPVTIDGSTQPGYDGTPLIEISGVNVPNDSGLVIRNTDGSKIRALSVINFGFDGITLMGDGTFNNTLEANYLGVGAGGSVAEGNGTAAGAQYGVRLTGGASGNTLEENLISGNREGGVAIIGGTSNKIIGNRIGTDITGAVRVPNFEQGVLITGSANSTSIRSNLISGNDGDGVHLFNSGDNFLFGNAIGTNLAGDQALENRGVGVYLTDTSEVTANNVIGSKYAGDGNLISGNFRDGIRIEGLGVSFALIQGNLIGTDGAGTSILANGDGGVAIINSANHQIGGPDLSTRSHGGASSHPSPSRRGSRSSGIDPVDTNPEDTPLGVANLLSGNGDDGVFIFGAESTNNLVSENLIGTSITGKAPLANNSTGVTVRSASYNYVTFNTISGNNVAEVRLEQGAESNQIGRNLIGTDPSGDTQVGGAGPGVLIETNSSANDVTLNVISGNLSDGVVLRSGASENGIQSNYIGTSQDGSTAIPNSGSGIRVESSGNSIGGNEGGGNLISGNRQDGILFTTSGATGNRVIGNGIGVNNSYDEGLPNERHGVSITDGAANNEIGNSSYGGNVIAFNRQTGVSVTGGTGNPIRGNQIYQNGRLGIDLNEDAITFNDPGDGDSGPNELQNFPVITEARSDEFATDVIGYLDSLPNQTYEIDIYTTLIPDGSGHGEGDFLEFNTTVTTDNSGHADFFVSRDGGVDPGTVATATATDANGNTSEFSANVGFDADFTPPVIESCDVSPRALPGNGGTVTFTATVTDNVGVAAVSAFVTGPGESMVVVPLVRQGMSDQYVGTQSIPSNTSAAPAQYDVKFMALDTASPGNQAAMDCGSFSVAVFDNTPPTIANCDVSPRSLPDIGGYVTFRAEITDPSGVEFARVVLTNPDATETVVPLNRDEAGDIYRFTYQVLGNSGTSPLTYGVRFEATDNVGNHGASDCGTLVVQPPDRTGPEITNCEVTPRSLPASGGAVLIRADITDPSDVNTAFAVITKPDSSTTQVSLVRQGETDTFQATYSAPANGSPNAATYFVKIAATDFPRNGSTADCGSFTVGGADSVPPVITNCQHSPAVLPPAGGPVTISADVTDNTSLRTVQGRVIRPDGTVAVVPLTAGPANHYTGVFQAPANSGTGDLTYTVFVVATDTGDNTAVARCGTFVVLGPDTQAPVITNCQVQPRRLPSAGGVFTVTATVTDNRGVASVVARVLGPGGTTTVPLAGTGSDYTGTFSAPENLSAQDVNYQVTLEATDTTGNPATSDCGTVTVLKPDGEAPVIVSCDVSPRTLLAPGGAVTLRADVTDNAGVDRVEALIEIPDVFSTTVALTLKSGSSYEGTWTAPANGTANPRAYHVTYRAVDTSGNEATADCGTVTVAAPDNQAPVISACQVAPRALLARGGAVTITATVTDDVSVSSVRAIVTRPDETTVQVELAPQGSNNYQGTLAIPANTGATPQYYQVEIRALDSTGNPASVDCGTFTVAIADTTAPVVTNCVVSPRGVSARGGTITITADVTDNVAVQSVVVEVTRLGGGGVTTSQLQSTGGSGYAGTVDLPANETTSPVLYRLHLVAADTTGNQTTEDCGVATVNDLDREAPSILSCNLSPNNFPFTGGLGVIQANVTDNVRVDHVVARILRAGNLVSTVDLIATAPPLYAANFAAPPNQTGSAQEYTVELVATDAEGNARTVPCGTYTVQADTVPPVILACDATPRALGASGGPVTFTATVTDSIPLARVVAIVTNPDGTTQRVVLASIGTDQYRGTWTVPANTGATSRTYTVALEAADVAENVSTADCGQFTVALASGGNAQVSTRDIPFGRVRFGTRVRRQFVIRNLSPNARLAVSLSTLFVPFSVKLEGGGVQGANGASGLKHPAAGPTPTPDNAISFSIAPGGIVTVFVDFAPPGIRNYSDRLLVTTSDPRHPEFRIRITGVGCKNGRRGTPIDTGGGENPGGGAPVKARKR